MTHTDNSTSPSEFSLSKRMLLGAAVGLAVISLFIFPIDSPDPAWGKFWMVRPMIMVPLAGAMGGLCNYFILQFHDRFGVNKIVAMIISFFVFMIGLWMGIVIGLDGTLWD